MCNEQHKTQVCPANQTYCSCIYTYEFNLNEVVEFVIVDEGFTFQSNHPMHLHGHRYAVLGIDKVNLQIGLKIYLNIDNYLMKKFIYYSVISKSR